MYYLVCFLIDIIYLQPMLKSPFLFLKNFDNIFNETARLSKVTRKDFGIRFADFGAHGNYLKGIFFSFFFNFFLFFKGVKHTKWGFDLLA